MNPARAVIPENRKGRLSTGEDDRDTVRTLRLSDAFLARVDTWADKQDDKPGRSEAIRRLVGLGLKARK